MKVKPKALREAAEIREQKKVRREGDVESDKCCVRCGRNIKVRELCYRCHLERSMCEVCWGILQRDCSPRHRVNTFRRAVCTFDDDDKESVADMLMQLEGR